MSGFSIGIGTGLRLIKGRSGQGILSSEVSCYATGVWINDGTWRMNDTWRDVPPKSRTRKISSK